MPDRDRPTGLLLLCLLAPLWGFVPPLLVGVNPLAPYGEGLTWPMLAEVLLVVGALTLWFGRRWGWSLLLAGLLWKAIPAALDARAMVLSEFNYEDYLPFAEGLRLGGWAILFAWLWTPGVQRHTRSD